MAGICTGSLVLLEALFKPRWTKVSASKVVDNRLAKLTDGICADKLVVFSVVARVLFVLFSAPCRFNLSSSSGGDTNRLRKLLGRISVKKMRMAGSVTHMKPHVVSTSVQIATGM